MSKPDYRLEKSATASPLSARWASLSKKEMRFVDTIYEITRRDTCLHPPDTSDSQGGIKEERSGNTNNDRSDSRHSVQKLRCFPGFFSLHIHPIMR